ncbi:hypothetical protein SY27_07355 [Flavobacterium sp. 316]|uniref:polyprenol phosphomannose-dependent alpha 1,6 mannosyltransferase MptB n=1 Tax=Flavobacterium sp. 316 TaxID=1603293 RepID=UPI0005E7439F|nr:polyprenol phosphomannose-dependent alpha 1,6 mannosyltransferase MptB [Flavobacterium sp. 316]KIX21511.1 hypothetical protein SY27_07355 [Flavobacterium sp. 316]
MDNLVAKYKKLFLIILSILAYIGLGYFVPRENFIYLASLYTITFLCFYYIYKYKMEYDDKILFRLGLLLRFLLLFCLPFWSQDFYRFIWDGRLILSEMSPYAFKPQDIIDSVTISQSKELFEGMGSLSAQHYSNYPPVNQILFVIAAILSSKSIFFSALILKIIVLLSDVGIYYYGKKVLRILKINPKRIFLYFLNPLVIIELTGNLHFEGVMLLFFVMGLYFFFLEREIISAVLIGLSIATKLLPLLLLPFFFQKLKLKKSIVFYSIIIGLNVLLFLPFITKDLIANYSETIALWFVNFEFNASFYYLFREIGFYIKGYNTIGIIGKITPVVSILIILFYSLYKKNIDAKEMLTNSLIALSFYFFISTTIHPWYLINLMLLCIFTKFRFPIIWAFFVILSYFAYSQTPFKESYVLIFLEYLFVISFLIYESFPKIFKNNSVKMF